MKKSPLSALREFSSQAALAGVRVRARMDRPTFLDEEEAGIRFTIALPEPDHAVLDELAKLQNDLIVIQGRKRVRKSKINRIVQRMVAAQIDALGHQMGVDLRDPVARSKRFDQVRAEARLEAAALKSKSKK
jgi:hypothetical protein